MAPVSLLQYDSEDEFLPEDAKDNTVVGCVCVCTKHTHMVFLPFIVCGC